MRGSLFTLEGFGVQDLGRLFLGRICVFFLVTGRDGKGGGRGRALEFSVMFFI